MVPENLEGTISKPVVSATLQLLWWEQASSDLADL